MIKHFLNCVLFCSAASFGLDVSADEVRNAYPTSEGLDVKVAPLLDSAWYQAYPPFTNMTPRDSNGWECTAGCVATALSQVMRYDRCPEGRIQPFSNECTVDEQPVTLEVDGAAYDWNNMPGVVYGVELTDAQEHALAKLTRDVGIAVGMAYTYDFSAADLINAAAAMTNRFGYASVKYAAPLQEGVDHDKEGGLDFEKYLRMVRDNLDRGRPVLVALSGSYHHAVVVDGYGTANGETYYHAIVGGGARYNAWYRLPNLDLADIDGIQGHRFSIISELVYDIETPAAPDYIVIAPPAYVDLWTWYVGERAKLPGAKKPDGSRYTFGVKNAQEIYDAYPYDAANTDGKPRNPAESIHQWIGEQVKKGTKYFVLGGNWCDAQNPSSLQTLIPGIVAYPFASRANAGPMTINPSDMYYACHEKDADTTYVWDPNGDAVYVGLKESNPDVFVSPKSFQPSVVIARMGFHDDREQTSYEVMVRNYVEKLKKGEAEDFSGRDKYAVWTSFCVDFDEEGYPDVYGVMSDRLEAILETRPTDSEYEHYVRMEDEDYADNIADAADVTARNWELFLPFGHGQPGAFAGLEGSDFEANTGLMKFFMGNVPCFTGAVNSRNNCATVGLGNPNGGFLVSINNTSFGWASPTGIQQRYLGVSDEIVDWCLDAYVKDGATAGEAWRQALHTYAGIVLDPETKVEEVAKRDHTGYEDCVYAAIVEEMLFGDPLIRIDYTNASPTKKRRVPRVLFR